MGVLEVANKWGMSNRSTLAHSYRQTFSETPTATLRNDLDENKVMYGQKWTSKQILGSGAKPPESASKLLAALNKYSMKGK